MESSWSGARFYPACRTCSRRGTQSGEAARRQRGKKARRQAVGFTRADAAWPDTENRASPTSAEAAVIVDEGMRGHQGSSRGAEEWASSEHCSSDTEPLGEFFK